jgi:hypothetical protein
MKVDVEADDSGYWKTALQFLGNFLHFSVCNRLPPYLLGRIRLFSSKKTKEKGRHLASLAGLMFLPRGVWSFVM